MLRFDIDFDLFGGRHDYHKAYCNSWVATAVIGSSVIGGLGQAYMSNKAAKGQAEAAKQGAALQQEAIGKANQTIQGQIDYTRGQGQQNREAFNPYLNAGSNATAELQKQLPFLTSGIDITQELKNPESTAAKAYNFNLQQGLKATQNSAAARGLGVSGAALKGAAAFTTGLTDNTYNTLFNMENTNRTNAYNRLKGLVDTGETAAYQSGSLNNQVSQIGMSGANQMGNNLIAGGNAAQGGLVGASNAEAQGYNALGGAIANTANNVGGYLAYRNRPTGVGAPMQTVPSMYASWNGGNPGGTMPGGSWGSL